jgi:murein DD-endopeptidase MepM/ murein hydrolase activator NlpD
LKVNSKIKPNYLAVSIILVILIFSFPSTLLSQNDPPCQWHDLYVKIRDRLITKEESLCKLKELEILLKDFYSKNPVKRQEDRLCFPLNGYPSQAIGGNGGNGYQPRGYDFFEGNDHKGHPGHDLFILDKNQDGIDDKTGKPVEVLSVSSGIVVSINLDWTPSSPIRGGNYIWTFEPIQSRYYYYAHLNEISVRIGQIVSRGERLGTVGRTGVKAYPRRSPTHLHFVAHHSTNGYPKPINPFGELLRSKRE